MTLSFLKKCNSHGDMGLPIKLASWVVELAGSPNGVLVDEGFEDSSELLLLAAGEAEKRPRKVDVSYRSDPRRASWFR